MLCEPDRSPAGTDSGQKRMLKGLPLAETTNDIEQRFAISHQ
jgi:hypothetical protein